VAVDKRIRGELLVMLADDQEAWTEVLDLVGRDEAFAEKFREV
jgi:hypothetical protein